ncbi:MAG: DPP IV N-terminal domain-containing protein [Acidobacteriia bacterium]|nr:DPP IV N-terminal domain-containing protein [Terriglobia bacterium]
MSMVRRGLRFLLLIVLLGTCSFLQAQQKLLTLDEIYSPDATQRVNFSGNPPRVVRWLSDDAHYVIVKLPPNAMPGGGREMRGQWIVVNAVSGEEHPFFDASKMEAAFAKLPGFSEEQARAVAHRGNYELNKDATAALINFDNDLFYYRFGSDEAVRLTRGPELEEGEEFSPDGRLVAFVRNYNLFVVDIATQSERALTTEGNENLLFGRLDWVYQEEVYGRGNYGAYWWSPDSKSIVFLRLDESKVKHFPVVDHIPYDQVLEDTRYPIAGAPNPEAELGVINVSGGPVRWIDNFKYHGGEFLIARVGWTPDSKKIVYEIQDREQTWLDLNTAVPRDGASTTLLRETSKAWVNVVDLPTWLKDGSFLWESERTGWKHLYHYAADGKLIAPVTSGSWEIRRLLGVDEAGGYAYFTSDQYQEIGNQAFRVKLDGSGLERLTSGDGTHNPNFNPKFTMYVDTWSDANTPSKMKVYKTGGDVIRVAYENDVPKLKEYKLSRWEFFKVKTRDGFEMEAQMLKPPDFDSAKKYPVMSYTYSGPHNASVHDAWGGPTGMWYQMLAEKGYIIWICDNRSASGKGAQSVWPIYKNFGELELRDLEDGVAWLKKQPYVDGSRMGLWGWSFGGFMTSYTLTHSTSFKIGIAGGTVTDWRDYDSIYTERYMRMPQNNPEGYKTTAPRAAAKNLYGKLLLIHGAIDDNVHMANTIQFIYDLEKAGKQFDLMIYPKSRHGVVDPVLVRHLRELMTDFILKNL